MKWVRIHEIWYKGGKAKKFDALQAGQVAGERRDVSIVISRKERALCLRVPANLVFKLEHGSFEIAVLLPRQARYTASAHVTADVALVT